jgi:hypothetical protein
MSEVIIYASAHDVEIIVEIEWRAGHNWKCEAGQVGRVQIAAVQRQRSDRSSPEFIGFANASPTDLQPLVSKREEKRSLRNLVE